MTAARRFVTNDDDPNSWYIAYWPKIWELDFRDFSRYPLETNTRMILNGFTSRNAVALNEVSEEARQLVHLYQYVDQETFDSNSYR
jgi:hypothetical protein